MTLFAAQVLFQRFQRRLTLSDVFYATRGSFAITSLCIGIYVYKLSIYARLHRYIDLDAICVVVLYNRNALHDDGIYGCPLFVRSSTVLDRTM